MLMSRWLAPGAALILLCAPVLAQSEDIDLPRPRPDAENREPEVPLPRRRPAAEISSAERSGATSDEQEADDEPRIYQAACPAVLDGRVTAELRLPLNPEERVCRQHSPYEVTAVEAGGKTVALTAPATVGCEMATALAGWLERIDPYMRAQFGAGIAEVQMGTSFMCRSRNGEEGADMSEHGFANGLDVTGFTLTDGQSVTLPENWDGDSVPAKAMRHAHGAACGFFTTVLGPDVNALHADHLHLDMGCHGQRCTYRLCE